MGFAVNDVYIASGIDKLPVAARHDAICAILLDQPLFIQSVSAP